MPKNALELLKEDHRKVKELLSELVQTTTRAEKKRQNLLNKIDQELHVHTHIEEEIFYPAFKEADGAEFSKMYFEALEEHRAVDELVLPDLRKTSPTSEKFSGRAKVLKELIEHHVEEEEKEMFKKAQKAMSKEQLNELGERMAERKLELQRQMQAGRAA
ncbi:MAG TPA: hemerythrin domain-containing protein [Woeseiaceae bacterium]|nr:hemerythrin domain-containing protein [Woeseiaceae bacterium]